MAGCGGCLARRGAAWCGAVACPLGGEFMFAILCGGVVVLVVLLLVVVLVALVVLVVLVALVVVIVVVIVVVVVAVVMVVVVGVVVVLGVVVAVCVSACVCLVVVRWWCGIGEAGATRTRANRRFSSDFMFTCRQPPHHTRTAPHYVCTSGGETRMRVRA